MYDDFAETFSGSRRNHPWKEIDVILDSIPDGSSILDVGCGNGRLLEEAEKKGKVFRRYLGIDASSGMIHEAEKVFPDQEFRVLSMESLGSIEETFDTIIFLASFHHLRSDRDRRETLRETGALLAPGGRIYLTNWNLLEQPQYAHAHEGNGNFMVKIGAHARYYHGFTLSELEQLFHSTGFTIIENRIFEGGRNIYSVLEK